MKILEYHEIVSGKPDEIHAVRLTSFAEQSDWLHQAGYHVISLSDWIKTLTIQKTRQPGRSIAITFDDGYQDNYTNAMPVLQQHGFNATIFLTTSQVGATSTWREGALAVSPMVSWDQAREMANLGVVFGSHSVTHTDLTRLELQDLDNELNWSRQQIEQQLGHAVQLFSYPYSRTNSVVKSRVKEADYKAACTYLPFFVGEAGSDPFELQRIGILATDTLQDFIHKVRTSLRRRLLWHRSQLYRHLRGASS